MILLQLMDKNERDSSIIFTVVIPTKGRVNLLEHLFISLNKARKHSNTKIESIIIDDSPRNEQKKIEKLCEIYKVKLILGSSNVREKRNIGIAKAKGNIIFFVDSDCEVSPNIFLEHLKMYENPETAGVLGVTKFIGEKTKMWKIIERTKFLDAFNFAEKYHNRLDSAPWGTCTNLSVKKEILEEVQGFDTSFPFKLGGDDMDLGIRINKAGYKIKMNPEAVVFHTRETWSSFSAIIKRVFRWGRMDYHVLYKKHHGDLYVTFPKPIIIFLFYVIFGLIIFAFSKEPILGLLIPSSWLFFFIIIKALLRMKLKGNFKDCFYYLFAKFFHFTFSLGTMLESIKNISFSFFFKERIDDSKQMFILWSEKVYIAWSFLFTSIFVSILIFLWLI